MILKIALGDVEVPLGGKFLRENGETIRIRIDDSWDIEIYKTMGNYILDSPERK